jgi:flagellin
VHGVTGYTKGADSAAEVKGKAEVDFDGKTGSKVIGGKLTVGGTTYEFVSDAASYKGTGTAIEVKASDTAGAIATAFAAKVANASASGTKVTVEGADDKAVSASVTTVKLTNAGGLTLQIGDTADNFNKITVSVNNMHTTALGIDDVDIGNQDGAATAISKIKAAINTVSGTRGDLGALQNRLEHTSNNLSVMTENITDAESTIRDVDVAEEMMDYTKNNILIQSAQAMLAQANTVPQGVLQLLQ